MEAKELRIGNKVGFYKSELPDLQIGTIAEILLRQNGPEYNYTVPEFSPAIPLPGSAIKPILLTREWAEKLGLIKRSENVFWVDTIAGGGGFVLKFSPLPILHIVPPDDNGSMVQGYDLKVCYFVHEFQNLLFSLQVDNSELYFKQLLKENASTNITN